MFENQVVMKFHVLEFQMSMNATIYLTLKETPSRSMSTTGKHLPAGKDWEKWASTEQAARNDLSIDDMQMLE